MSIAAGEPPYRAPESRGADSGPGMVFACITIGCSLLFWSAAAFQVIFLVPRFVKVFDDFRMVLPLSTQLVVNHAIWILPATMLASFLLCALLRSRGMWILLLLVLPALVNLAVIVCLYYPQMQLLEGLAK